MSQKVIIAGLRWLGNGKTFELWQFEQAILQLGPPG
jgi:hypothetical protein